MRTLLVAALLLMAGAAHAAPPAEGYLAARDREIARINRSAGAAADPEADSRALAGLETMLRRLVGPVELKGFPREGRISLVTLVREAGFGHLDGLVHESTAGGTSVLVTTVGLLKAWLKVHRDWWPDEPALPRDPKEALRSEAFYTQAVSSDAAVAKYAEIPIAPRPGPAVALLILRRQDVGHVMPNEIVVSAVRGRRLYIAMQPAGVEVTPIAACEEVWRRHHKKAEAALAAYWSSGSRDQALFDQSVRLDGEGDAAYRRGFAEHVREEPYHAALVRQAQALANALPGD